MESSLLSMDAVSVFLLSVSNARFPASALRLRLQCCWNDAWSMEQGRPTKSRNRWRRWGRRSTSISMRFVPTVPRRQPVRFDMRSFLYGALSHEKQFLLYEVHRIALAYRWSHDEILSLSRNDRRSLVRLIESERATRRRTQLWTDI